MGLDDDKLKSVISRLEAELEFMKALTPEDLRKAPEELKRAPEELSKAAQRTQEEELKTLRDLADNLDMMARSNLGMTTEHVKAALTEVGYVYEDFKVPGDYISKNDIDGLIAAAGGGDPE